MMNKIITSEGNVQFQTADGKIVNVHPNHVYAVFNEDTVSFILIALPPSSGLAIMASKAEDLELDGQTYSIADLPNAVAEAFAEAGAQARCEIVDELPTTGKTNTIYLVPKEEGDGYDEYIYLKDEQRWELIGDTSIEMDNYLKKVDFNAYSAATEIVINSISGAVDDLSSELDAEISNREAADSVISGAVDNVSTDLSNEVQRAISAETELSDKIDAASGDVEDIQAEVDVLSADLEDEVSARTQADEALDDKIDGKVVELTQAEYDSLVDKDPLVLYVITDAVEVNMNDYYKKTETSGATEIQTALNSKLDATAYTPTDLSNYYTKDETSGKTEIATALNGKQKTIASGRGITITTGSTADTVSFNLPIYSGGSYAISFTQPIGSTQYDNKVSGFSATAIGAGLNSTNSYETAFGVHNVNKPAPQSLGFGNSGCTLMTVGNGGGSGANQRHNAFEIRQNGDIYIADTNDTTYPNFYDKPMIKLQDALGQGGISSGEVQTMIDNSISGKVDTSDFNTYSGDVDSRLAEDEEVTAAALNDLNDELAAKQDTLVSSVNIKTINNESILGSGNIDIQGGGSTYTAGRGIDITNDTISVSLPISAGTGTNSVIEGHTSNKASGTYSHAEGKGTTASGSWGSHAEGSSTVASGGYSHAEGNSTTASSNFSHTEGYYTKTTNESEHASGQYNVSYKSNTTFGDSGNTLFSVGNGTANNARHNAFEIRQNGDIYLTKDGQDVKLQDQLGGGSITVDTALDSGSTNPVENRVIYNKIDEVEQVTAAGLNALNDALGGLKLKKLTQAEYDALSPNYDSNTLYVIT